MTDTHGHPAGDQVLRTIGSRLTTGLSDSAIVCRHGGDEFFLVLLGTSSDQQLRELTSGLHRSIEQPIHLGEAEIVVSASIGLAVLTTDGFDLDRAFAEADHKMYRAKQARRQRSAKALPPKRTAQIAAAKRRNH